MKAQQLLTAKNRHISTNSPSHRIWAKKAKQSYNVKKLQDYCVKSYDTRKSYEKKQAVKYMKNLESKKK